MNNATIIMQGDQYAIPFEILSADETAADADTFADVEIVIGTLKKRLSAGEITYSKPHGAFLFPLTQAETFAMSAKPEEVQVRVKNREGDVIGLRLGQMIVETSLSKEVL